MKKYRIKRVTELNNRLEPYSVYIVQGKTHLGLWVTIKRFDDPTDPSFAFLEAEELLEKLQD